MINANLVRNCYRYNVWLKNHNATYSMNVPLWCRGTFSILKTDAYTVGQVTRTHPERLSSQHTTFSSHFEHEPHLTQLKSGFCCHLPSLKAININLFSRLKRISHISTLKHSIPTSSTVITAFFVFIIAALSGQLMKVYESHQALRPQRLSYGNNWEAAIVGLWHWQCPALNVNHFLQR